MMMTGAPGASWARVSVAWMPSMIGMLTSIKTMSGATFLACSTPSLPLTAVATTWMPGLKDSTLWGVSWVLWMSCTIRELIGVLILESCYNSDPPETFRFAGGLFTLFLDRFM